MKKRIACLLLTLVMLVSLIPTAVITASAASVSVSEAGIRVIKDYMGFKKNAYKVGTGYKIGYGTDAVEGQTITEANADQLLREKLSQVAATISSAITVNLVQKRQDALVWYSYVYGTGWTASGLFVNAVNNNVTGSAFADIMCSWDYDAGSRAFADTEIGTLVNRMAMANLYQNGIYSSANVGSLGYTILDAGEGAAFPNGAQKMVQVYDCSQVTKINVPDPTKAGNQLRGWFSGSALVTGVSSATKGGVLTAGWQDGTVQSVAVSYSLPAYVIYEASGLTVNEVAIVRAFASSSAQQVNVINRDETVIIVAETMVGGEKWLQLSGGGWVKLCSSISSVPTIGASFNVTMTDDYVNIREKPYVTSPKTAVAVRGESRTIVMTSFVGGKLWGYCSQGWLMLDYTTFSDKGGNTTQTVQGTGKISVASRVNVRTAAGVGSPLATTLANGTSVKIYEQTTVNGVKWARIDQGWVCMDYVMMDQTAVQTGASTSTGATAYVSSSVNLNVRSGPGTEYSVVSSLRPGTAVVILQKQTISGETWALIDQGWINMNYVSGAVSANGTSVAVNGIGGKVVNCSTGVNIRSAAGTTNALVGFAPLNSRVTVSERVEVNGHYWGHIEKGWVCMDYIQLDKEWTNPAAPSVELDNVVTAFEGYPALTIGTVELLAEATPYANVLMTLNNNEPVNIKGSTTVNVGTKKFEFGKVTVGSTTGWIEMTKLQKQEIHGKVTAERVDAYRLPSTRSQFYASLVKGTSVVIKDWTVADGIVWGMVQDAYSNSYYINLASVTMYKGNETPDGAVTLSGVGYMNGTVTADSILYEDFNGGVINNAHPVPVATKYTATAGHRVNVLGRNYASDGTTYAKVTVGSVTGWMLMNNISLDPVAMQTTMEVKLYASTAAVLSNTSSGVMSVGTKFTVEGRVILPNTNEINHGITDVAYGYVGDDAAHKFYVVADDGRMAYIGSANAGQTVNPSVVSSVVLTVKAPAELKVYEETTTTSAVLLKQAAGSTITILNWKNADGKTWGKVQIGQIVGWIDVAALGTISVNATVNVTDLPVYADADKNSSVQILHVNGASVYASPVYFDGTTVWGNISISSHNGWIDMANVNTSKQYAVYTAEPVIATARVNSINVNAPVMDAPSGSAGMVTTLAKATSVNLTDVAFDSTEKAWWRVDLGDKDGWIAMSDLAMNPATARVAQASLPIYNDLTSIHTASEKILHTMYAGETINVIGFKEFAPVADSVYLFGEVTYGNTTGWIQISTLLGTKLATLTPGSTGTTVGGNTSGSTTAPTTPSTPAADPVDAHIVCSTTVNVRSGAGVDNNLVTTLRNGTNVKIYEQTLVNGIKWARIDQGWVCMDYVEMGTVTTTNGGAGSTTGTITVMTSVPSGAIAVGYANEDVRIRSGHALGYPEVAVLKKGNSVVIYERVIDGNMVWGRTDNGWVCITYLTLTGIGASGTGTSATIGRCGFAATVRNTPSYGGDPVGKVMVSSRINILETSGVWARTAMGWICTDYIVMDADQAPAPVPQATEPAATEPVNQVIEFVG